MVVKNVEKKENSTVTFQVEIDKAEFEVAVNKAYIKNKKSIVITLKKRTKILKENGADKEIRKRIKNLAHEVEMCDE